MADRRKGRGRLSTIDLLPEEAADAVKWAYDELRKRERTQQDIHSEFNFKLAEQGILPISFSAFNRHSIRLAGMARRHEEVRAITSALTERLDPTQADDLTIMAAETIKTIVFELMEGEGVTPKNAMELARALQSAVHSQNLSLDRRRALQTQFSKQVDEAITAVQSETGLSEFQAKSMRAKVLGLKL